MFWTALIVIVAFKRRFRPKRRITKATAVLESGMGNTDYTDPRLQPGAYISSGPTLWLVVGRETDDDGNQTHKVILENARDGNLVSEARLRILGFYALCRRAPKTEVPAYLVDQIRDAGRGVHLGSH